MAFIGIYFLNVLAIAIPLAIFEIWLEGYKTGPWGATEFHNSFWEKKITGKGNKFTAWLMSNVLEKEYISIYHVIMFLGIVPVITLANYTFMLHLYGGTSWYRAGIGGVDTILPIFLIAIWVGNTVVEDFLWFAIQTLTGWREREALPRLLAGKFVWHTRWLYVSPSIMVPRFYVTTWYWVALLLLVSTSPEWFPKLCVTVY